MNHFNKLTPAEHERISILNEEMGEAIQVIGKILRHGFNSYDPTIEKSPTNRKLLEKELGDVRQAIIMMCSAEDIDAANIQKRIIHRHTLVKRYTHHQKV